jgi:hypothetical protein
LSQVSSRTPVGGGGAPSASARQAERVLIIFAGTVCTEQFSWRL